MGVNLVQGYKLWAMLASNGVAHLDAAGEPTFRLSKNSHLSIAAGIATSKNPTIISSDV